MRSNSYTQAGLGLSAAVALAVGGAVSPAAAVVDPGAAPDRIRWSACGQRLECATVPVPLDWARPGGPTISLALTRYLAGRPGQRIGSLFLNPGGPGDSGVDAVTQRGESLDALTGGRFNVVGWDLRGTARSSAVQCFVDSAQRERFWHGTPVPISRAEEQRYLAKTKALAGRCGERNGALLEHLSSADMARDLDHLRRLTGDPRLTFIGQSLGTLIGQTYANMFPRRVRAMVLDGLVDPVVYRDGTAATIARSLTDVDELFGQFQLLCTQAGPTRCALAGDEPVGERVHALLRRLRHTPIPAPSASPPGALTYAETITALKLAVLPQPVIWPQAAALIAQAEAGDASVLATIARGYAAEPLHHGLEPNVALTCSDAPARQQPRQWPDVVDRLRAVSTVGAAPMAWLVGAPCTSWPARPAQPYLGPWNATTDNPILLIGTRLDPNTPLVNARIAERRLGNAVLLTHDGYGHLSSADPSACVQRATGRYLVGLVVPQRGTVCRSDRLPFHPDFGQPLG